jgi:hypothetical protein
MPKILPKLDEIGKTMLPMQDHLVLDIFLRGYFICCIFQLLRPNKNLVFLKTTVSPRASFEIDNLGTASTVNKVL